MRNLDLMLLEILYSPRLIMPSFSSLLISEVDRRNWRRKKRDRNKRFKFAHIHVKDWP